MDIWPVGGDTILTDYLNHSFSADPSQSMLHTYADSFIGQLGLFTPAGFPKNLSLSRLITIALNSQRPHIQTLLVIHSSLKQIIYFAGLRNSSGHQLISHVIHEMITGMTIDRCPMINCCLHVPGASSLSIHFWCVYYWSKLFFYSLPLIFVPEAIYF